MQHEGHSVVSQPACNILGIKLCTVLCYPLRSYGACRSWLGSTTHLQLLLQLRIPGTL
jgi:hypothetical protein